MGTIPAGIIGLRVELTSDRDVDIRLYGENDDRIVHWPYGIMSFSYAQTKPYKNVPISYSGYNGVDGKRGHEYIEVNGTTPTAMTMKAFGYQAGYATVNYSWTGKEGCTQDMNGTGSFQHDILYRATNLVGTIPPNVHNVEINLTSDKDLDIQLYGVDGTAIASWKPAGLMAGATKQSILYHDMNITWSGYNGVDGHKGHEYITIKPKTTEELVMKVYGYEAGVADVTYSWGDDQPINNAGFEVSPLNGTSKEVYFYIKLKEKPENNVSILFGSADETIVKTQLNQLVFTPDDWYKSQKINIDIIDTTSSTEIIFEPVVSDDIHYNNQTLEDILVVSHQLNVYEPHDKIVYSEFEMAIPIEISYVGDNIENISITLDDAPNGMVLDTNNSRLIWTPPFEEEGNDIPITLGVNDGKISSSVTYSLHVAKTRLLDTVINTQYNILIITDTNSSLKDMNVVPLEDMNLSDYKLYAVDKNGVPSLGKSESAVGDVLLIKGNAGKKVKVMMGLKGLVTKDELLSFHTKSYFGSGNWRRIDYDYDFKRSIDDPVYDLNTFNFYGLLAFTKENATKTNTKISQQGVAFSKTLASPSVSGIECVPKKWFLDLLTDYDNQICTFDDKPDFKLQIFNYTNASITNRITIKTVASWIIKAQMKAIKLGMPYKTYSAVSFQEIPNKPNRVGETGEWGNVDNGIFVNYPKIFDFTLSTLDYVKLGNDIHKYEITLYHEYFHQLQAAISNNILVNLYNNPKPKWIIEASAVWFSDYVDENTGYAYSLIGNPYRLLSQGLYTDRQPIFNGYSKLRNDVYKKAYFLEMLEKYCPNFTQVGYIPFLFTVDPIDPTGLGNLSTIVYNSNCDFQSTPLGDNYKSLLETSILYYQYIASMKQNSKLINSNLNINFEFLKDFKEIKQEEWVSLTLDKYKKLYLDENLNRSIDSQAITIKIEALNDTLPRCQERYIRIKPEEKILISLASKSADMPDTPEYMLGDMKQISFTTKDKYDFTYFYNQNIGKQVYPELFLTLIDMVDNTKNMKTQKIELGIGLRKTNIISFVDNKDYCSGNNLGILNSTYINFNGHIPNKYSNNNDVLNYINYIKIEIPEAGREYVIEMENTREWSKNIDISYNGAVAHYVSVSGYNSSDLTRIIARNGLNINQ